MSSAGTCSRDSASGNRLQLYTPTIQPQTPGPSDPMPAARGALSVAEYEGKLYAIGGYDRKANSAAVKVYDPARNTLDLARVAADTSRSSGDRDRVREGVCDRGRLNGDYRRNISVAEVYDPVTDRWARAADLRLPAVESQRLRLAVRSTCSAAKGRRHVP